MPMGLRDCKRDDRPQKGAWAPGNYMNKCSGCGCGFIGDKRAYECADCAYRPMPRARIFYRGQPWQWFIFNPLRGHSGGGYWAFWFGPFKIVVWDK